jgi:LacI family transcriptional regulator
MERIMGSRPTIADLANKAGVSVATVDRVLNGRHRVREDTARRVHDAAVELGYHATSLIRQRIVAGQPELRFGFLLQKQHQLFYQALAGELEKAVDGATDIRGRSRVVFVQEQTPEVMAGELARMKENCDAVAVVSMDHHLVTEAVADLKKSEIPVFSLLSDFAQGVRDNYVGLNNMRVGRTAAWLISRTVQKPGKVAVFVGSHRWHGHELRETGFRSYFREYAPDFEILDTMVNLDTRQVTHEATLSLLNWHHDIAGFYVAGGGMEGAIKALREVLPDPLPSVVVNELTDDSRAALQDRIVTAVLATPLQKMCRTLVDLMIATVREGPSNTRGQVFLPFDIHVPESV